MGTWVQKRAVFAALQNYSAITVEMGKHGRSVHSERIQRNGLECNNTDIVGGGVEKFKRGADVTCIWMFAEVLVLNKSVQNSMILKLELNKNFEKKRDFWPHCAVQPVADWLHE